MAPDTRQCTIPRHPLPGNGAPAPNFEHKNASAKVNGSRAAGLSLSFVVVVVVVFQKGLSYDRQENWAWRMALYTATTAFDRHAKHTQHSPSLRMLHTPHQKIRILAKCVLHKKPSKVFAPSYRMNSCIYST